MSDLDDVLYVPLFPSQNSLHIALDQAKKAYLCIMYIAIYEIESKEYTV